MNENIETRPPNRKERRHQQVLQNKQIPASLHEIRNDQIIYSQTSARISENLEQAPKVMLGTPESNSPGWNIFWGAMTELRKLVGKNQMSLYAPLVYHSAPVLLDYAVAVKNLHQSTEDFGKKDADKLNLRDFYETLSKANLYTYRPKNGMTLAEIEQLALPLQSTDIRSINATVRVNPFSKESYKSSKAIFLRHIALFLPSQVLAREKEITVPEQIKPLILRLINYLDYYVPFLLRKDIDNNSFDLFCMNLIYLGIPFQQALGIYMPARTGLTPASLIKLYDEQEYTGNNPIVWKQLNVVLKPETAESYTASGLPDSLSHYQLYSAKQDTSAAAQLGEHYKSHIEDTQTNIDEVRKQLSRLSLYRKNLYPEMFRGLDIDLGDHPVISRIVLACQNKQNIMYILLLNDGKTHLTLETTEEGEIYGIPHQLNIINPQIKSLLLTDILTPVLERAQKMFPQVEESDKPELRPTKIQILPARPVFGIPQQFERKKHRSMPAVVLHEPQLPVLPKPEEINNTPYQLVYEEKGRLKSLDTEDDLIEFANGKARSLAKKDLRCRDDVLAILKAIIEDPRGKGAYKLNDYNLTVGERRQNLWAFRGDDRNLRFQHPESRRIRTVFYFDPMNSSIIHIEDILHHNDFDKKYTA